MAERTGGAMTRGSTGGTGGVGRRAVVHVVALVAALVSVGLLAGCSSQLPAGTPPIPTFPGPGAAATTSAPPPRSGILPTDCNQVLGADVLPNLLGLPLGSIKVTALRDVPAPSVGRLERVTCNYTSLGGPGTPPNNALVLKVISGGYANPESAAGQEKINQDSQQQAGIAPEPVPLGAARATFFDDPDGRQLVVVFGRVTTSLTFGTQGPIPNDQARTVLTDLAQRALPVLVPSGP